jgi:hypothetical protein
MRIFGAPPFHLDKPNYFSHCRPNSLLLLDRLRFRERKPHHRAIRPYDLDRKRAGLPRPTDRAGDLGLCDEGRAAGHQEARSVSIARRMARIASEDCELKCFFACCFSHSLT